MTVPVVDLSLPPDDQLLVAATPNPRTEADRLTVTGKPDRVANLGLRLQQAGAELDRLCEQSWRAQRVLAGAFANDGAPVYDETAHRQLLPIGFTDAGTRLHDVGRRVDVVSQELASAITDLTGSLDQLQTDLNRSRSAFAVELATARGLGGLIPVEMLGQLQAHRAIVAAQMQELVNACGRAVVGRIARYEEVLTDCQRLLGEFGPPRAVVDTTGTRLNPVVSGQFEGGVTGFTTPTPQGPTAEIHPIPPPLPREPGFTPAPVGPGSLITLPAPSLGAGVQDGPGSGQRGNTPPITIDANASPPQPPAAGAGGPIAGGVVHRGNFPTTAQPNDILVRYGNDGKVNNYEVYGPDGLPEKRVDVPRSGTQSH